MQSNVSAIIFDLGGVILNLDYNATIKAFQELGKSNFDSLYTQAQQNDTFDLYETGKIESEAFRSYLSSLLEDANDEKIDEAWNAMLLDLPNERIELLEKLGKRYRIFLFSNTNAIHYRKFREDIEKVYGNADLLETIFEKTYYSHLIGERKPNPSAFKYILDENQLNPETTLFIDDSFQHIEGASSLGIQTIHLVDKDIVEVCTPLL